MESWLSISAISQKLLIITHGLLTICVCPGFSITEGNKNNSVDGSCWKITLLYLIRILWILAIEISAVCQSKSDVSATQKRFYLFLRKIGLNPIKEISANLLEGSGIGVGFLLSAAMPAVIPETKILW